MNPTASYRKPQLLIVDDTPTNIEILLDALEQDYEVSFSTSGEEALQLIAESETPDLILLDVMMPNMDGYEVCRRLKQNAVTRNIPIIFVTAMGSTESESIGLALGADDYIAKPINLDISRLRIKNVLERTKLGRELELTLACSSQGLWEWDLPTDIVSLDSRWAMPLGYQMGELKDCDYHWEELLHPQDATTLREAYEAHLNGSTSEINIEVRLRNKDNAFSWMQILGKATSLDHAGKARRIIGTYMDINQRKRADSTIRAHELRMASLIASIPDAVIGFDTAGLLFELHIPDSLSALQRVASWEKRPISEVFPAEINAALIAGMLEALDSRVPFTQQCKILTAAGHQHIAVTVTQMSAPDSPWPNGFLAVMRDVSQARHAEEELRRQALHDPLTALPNRRLLKEWLTQAQSQSVQENDFAALMLLDLDKFKLVNDTYGHEVGDQLLIELARRLQEVMRDNDTIARLGGDEFVILVERLGPEEHQARQKMEAISKKLAERLNREYVFGGISLHCTASIGIKIFQGQDSDVNTILQAADVAMYKTKESKDVQG